MEKRACPSAWETDGEYFYLLPKPKTFWPMVLIKQNIFPQVEMTGDYTPDLMALLSADIIISTPEKWDGISRNWHSRNYVKKVHLFTSRYYLFSSDLVYFL